MDGGKAWNSRRAYSMPFAEMTVMRTKPWRIVGVTWSLGVVLAWAWMVHPHLSDVLEATRQYLTIRTFDWHSLKDSWGQFGLAVVAACGVLAASWRAGASLDRVLGIPPGQSAISTTTVVGFGLGTMALAILGAGFVGLLPTLGLWGPVAAGALAIGQLVVSWRPIAARMTNLRPPQEHRVAWVVVAVGLAVVAMGLLNIEITWDALMYHLRIPSFYQYRHKVFDVWHHYYAVYPANVEMLYLGARLLQGDLAVRLISAILGVLFVAAAAQLAGMVATSVPMTLLLLVGSPMLLILMSVSFIDIGLALFATLAAIECFRDRGRWDRITATRVGVFIGFAMGTKYTGVLLMPALAAAVGPRRWRAAFVTAVTGGVLVAPWLLKNWVWDGNPVAPFLRGWFGGRTPLPIEVAPVTWLQVGRTGAPGEVWTVLKQMLLGDGGVGGTLHPMMLGLLPFVLFWKPSDRLLGMRRWFLAFGLAWACLSPNPRFLLPVIPLYVVLATARMTTLEGTDGISWRWLSRLIGLGATLGVGFAAATVWVVYDPLSLPLGFRSIHEKIRYTLFPVPFHGYLADEVERNVPRTDRLLYLSHFNSYYVERECVNDLRSSPQHLKAFLRSGTTAAGLAKQLREAGIHWIVSTGSLAREYSGVPGYFAMSPAEWSTVKDTLATRAEAVWQTDGLTLYRMGRPHARRALPDFPVLEAISTEEIDTAIQEGRWSDALAGMRRLPVILNDVGSTALREGRIRDGLGDLRGAVAAYRLAMSRGVDTPTLHGSLALDLLQLGRPLEAVPHANRAWMQHPLSATAAATLAVVLAATGDRAKAITMARRATELRPDRPEYGQLVRRLESGL